MLTKDRAFKRGSTSSKTIIPLSVKRRRIKEAGYLMAGTWMPRERWDALVRGENCPLCNEVLATDEVNEYGYTVADLSISRLRLNTNQYVAGYCVLICHKHVREPYELLPEERLQFFGDMLKVGRTLEKLYGADKMNFQILGNSVPHLHCHIVPRYYGDPAPGRPIDPNAKVVVLTPEQYEKRVAQIRRALGR